MYNWPLNNTTREVNKGFLNLRTLDGSPQRFIKGQAFFKEDCLVKDIESMDYLLGTDDFHISFEFENYPGMIEDQRYPIFSITPTSLGSGYSGANHENYGLRIFYSYPQGLEFYYLGDDSDAGGPALSTVSNLDVFWNEGSNLGGNPSTPGVGGGSEESPVIEIGGGGGGGGGSLYVPHWDYYNNRKHKLDLIRTKTSTGFTLWIYIDGILYMSNYSEDTFEAEAQLMVGGSNNYIYDGFDNNSDGVAYYNGCVSNLKISNSRRQLLRDPDLFYHIPKIGFGGSSDLETTLYMFGASGNNILNAGKNTLYIYGTTLSFYTEPRTLYVNGVISSFDADVGDARDLYISGSETEILTTTLFIQGASFEGDYTLFIEGQENTREYIRELYVYGSAGASDSIDDLYDADHVYTYEIPLFISTEASEDAQWEYPLYMKGGNPGSDAYRPLFIQNDAGISEFYRTAIIIGDGTFGGSSQYDVGLPLVMGRVESWGAPLFIGNPASSTSLATSMFMAGIAGVTATTTLVMPKVSGPADTRMLYIRGGG